MNINNDKNNNDTKAHIVATASNLFRTHGYQNVTVKSICEELNISAPTFYYHFKSKEEIIQCYYEKPNVLTIETMQELLAFETNYEQLWHLIELYIDHYMGMGIEILKEVIKANITNDKGTFITPAPDVYNLYVPIIKRAQNQGEIKNSSDPVELMKAGWIILIGSLTSWCINNGAFDLKLSIKEHISALHSIDHSTS